MYYIWFGKLIQQFIKGLLLEYWRMKDKKKDVEKTKWSKLYGCKVM